jgi:hypothetical protein
MPGCEEQHDFIGGHTPRGERIGRVGAPAGSRTARGAEGRNAGGASAQRPKAAYRSIADHRYATVIVRGIPRPVVIDVYDLTAW